MFVFAPLFFIFQIDLESVGNVLLAFICFCFTASSVYIMNDLFDRNSDQAHPIKRNRPIASGRVSVRQSIYIMGVLLLLATMISILISRELTMVLFVYFIMNLGYSTYLKHIPIIDVIIIAIGFDLRIMAGSYASAVPASYWLVGMTFVLALFLGFSKRRGELLLSEKRTEVSRSLKLYSYRLLNRILITLSVIICICYTAYTLTEAVMLRMDSNFVFFTAFWVYGGIYRYMKFVLSNTRYSDPTSVLLKDWKLQLIILGWMLTFILIKLL